MIERRRGGWWRSLALAYGLGFAGVLGMAYTGNLPPWFSGIPYADKWGHVILYAIATLLGHGALRGRGRWGSWPLFPLGFGLFTVAEEMAQGLSPNRTLDGLDLICSGVGIGVGYAIAEWLVRRGCRWQNQRP